MAQPRHKEIVVWGDNEARIKTIQTWFPPGSEQMYKPGRILVGEGILLKQCRKKMKPRQFFLFNDIIVFANIILPRKSYFKQRIIKLVEITIELSQSEKGFQILAPNKSFSVETATKEEAKEWMFHLNMCINSLPNKPASKPPSAALWIPDKEAEGCMVCQVKFTTFNRRHHCRNCGKVICGTCSPKKWKFPIQKPKPQRVCDECYKLLQKESENQNNNEVQGDRNFSQRKNTEKGENEYNFKGSENFVFEDIRASTFFVHEDDNDEEEEETEDGKNNFDNNEETETFA